MAQAFAQGTLLVTGENEIIIDEVLPPDRALLQDPEAYVSVKFDPNQPHPPPCAGGLPDELDWELFFDHVHDTGLFGFFKKKREQLRLRIMWRVQTSRTVVWEITTP